MVNLTIFRGDSKTYNITFTDSDSVAIDITGYTIYFTVKKKDQYKNSEDDDSSEIKKDVVSHTDPTAGKTQIVLSSDDTDIYPNTYFYDIQMKDVSDNITTITSGNFVVTADVTRRD